MGATKVTPIYYNSTDFQHFTTQYSSSFQKTNEPSKSLSINQRTIISTQLDRFRSVKMVIVNILIIIWLYDYLTGQIFTNITILN